MPTRALDVAGVLALALVHAAAGWLALLLAWVGRGDAAASAGAFAALAREPVGRVALWLLVVGLLGLVVWYVSQAARPRPEQVSAFRAAARVRTVGKAIVTLVLAVLAVRLAIDSGPSGFSADDGVTAALLDLPGGPILVSAVGLVIGAIGVHFVHEGWTARFRRKLGAAPDGTGPSRSLVWLGRVGHVAKGAAYGVIAILLVVAGFGHEDGQAGLDEALARFLEQPYGPWVATAVGLAFLAYAAYAIGWALWLRRAARS